MKVAGFLFTYVAVWLISMAIHNPSALKAQQLVFETNDKYLHLDLDALNQMLIDLNGGLLSRDDNNPYQTVRKLLAKALNKARREGMAAFRQQIPNNQRHAEQGLKAVTYKKNSAVLGGNINIYRPRRNGSVARRPIPAGKEDTWSRETQRYYGYRGSDAQFILNWLEMGTEERQPGCGRRRHGNYGTTTGSIRDRDFGGTHHVGRITPGKINVDLLAILRRVVNNEFIPDLEKQVQAIMNKTK